MKFSCLIVDDEPFAHEVLRAHFKTIVDVDLLPGFFNGIDAKKYLLKKPVDILIVDIQMPEVNGLELLRSLPVKPVCIISTAFRNYAFEGFELGVIDYILKPIPLERLVVAVKRATDFLKLERAANTSAVLHAEQNQGFLIKIKTGTKSRLIDYRKINYVQGLKDYTILATDEAKYLVKGSMKAMESFLPADYFLRVHKSFIIPKNKVKTFSRNKIDLGSIVIPVGRYYRAQVDEVLTPPKQIE